jgi:hypothetical protein
MRSGARRALAKTTAGKARKAIYFFIFKGTLAVLPEVIFISSALRVVEKPTMQLPLV